MLDDILLKRVQSFAGTVEAKLLTESEFRREFAGLLESLKDAGCSLKISVVTKKGDPVAAYGKNGETRLSSDSDTLGQLDYSIEADYCSGSTGATRADARNNYTSLRADIVRILTAFWGTRDGLTRLYRSGESSNLQRLESTIAESIARQCPLSVFHVDLDHFKNVNTEFGEPGGDVVLAEFAQRLRESFGEDALIIRKGGEEFSIFSMTSTLAEGLKRARTFKARMETEPFAQISRVNTCCIGISSFPEHYRTAKNSDDLWFDYLLEPAMQAETRAKNSGRNCISLPVLETSDTSPVVGDDALMQVVIGARLGWFGGGDGFQNEFQRMVARELFGELRTDPAGRCDEKIEKIRHDFSIELSEKESPNLFDLALDGPKIHPVIWLTIILHSALKASFYGKGPINADFEVQVFSQNGPEGKHILTAQLALETEITIEMSVESPDSKLSAGKPWISKELASGTGRHEQKSMSPILLMQIGQVEIPISVKAAVASIVEIDDRPVTGGGLPDFWQSNISRIVRIICESRNIVQIFVVGDAAKARKTIDLLRNAGTWNLALMSRRLSLDLEVLNDFVDRKLTIEEISGSLDGKVYEAFVSDRSAPQSVSILTNAYRKRRLNFKVEHLALPSTDGLKSTTSAEAYPRIISILHSESLPKNVDFFNREFIEVTAFKLVLTAPSEEKIPDYWSEDEGELESYFQRQFGKDGLFGLRLYSWGEVNHADQVKGVLEEAAKAIRGKIASRRIMLFIADSADDLKKPLGLVGVQILPRLVEGRWSISFNWIWRTVEALVGLPFSLYGSIRFSEELVNKLNQELTAEGTARVSIDTLTYIALSLHLFVDEGDQHIARAIVTAAI